MNRFFHRFLIAVIILCALQTLALKTFAYTPDECCKNYYASSTWQDDPKGFDSPYYAFNNPSGTSKLDWNSGNWGPSWIEVDLGAQFILTSLRRVPGVLPNTSMRSDKIYISDSPIRDDLTHSTLVVIENYPSDYDVWQETALGRKQGRYLQIRTDHQESWVSWLSIQVLGYSATSPGTPVNLSTGLCGRLSTIEKMSTSYSPLESLRGF